jgi:GNAT superfamily N-acetyltransferase
MKVRQATRADNRALCALEARTPLNMGDNPLYLRPDNFFDKHELQERTVVMVAEEAGEIIGVCAGALHRVPLAGRERLLLYIHHERIAPEHQRKGIGGALARAIAEYWKQREQDEIESSYWYIASANRQSRNFAERGGNRPWPVSLYLCTVPAVQGGVRQRLGPIGAGPIFDIVRLVNATHTGEELFRPYGQVDFGARLSRSVEYGWGDVFGRCDARGRLVAVAGLWKDHVADYGYEPGAEGELAALLRDLAAVRGDLSLVLDGRSPLFPVLGLDKGQQLELLLYTPRVQAPAQPGLVYVDPVYF